MAQKKDNANLQDIPCSLNQKSRNDRVEILRLIEEHRQSHVIAYILGDRQFLSAQIGTDAIRPLFDHLRSLNNGQATSKPIDLYIYSHGGRLEVPWPLVNTVREFTKEFRVLVPYRAHSAATMIAMGADKILMGPKGELGPIDPQLQVPRDKSRSLSMGVEDITAYLTFIKEKGGLSDQGALSQLVSQLAAQVNPTILGGAYRAYSHVRLVGRKLLALHNPPLAESTISNLVEQLTEKIYLHGHAIARREAKEMGLDVELMDEATDSLTWRLLECYESLLDLRESHDPQSMIPDDSKEDEYLGKDFTIAVIENVKRIDAFCGDLNVKRIRKTPPQVTLNVQVPAPSQVMPGMTEQQLQTLMGKIVQGALPAIQREIQTNLRLHSPVEGVKVEFRNSAWRNVTDSLQGAGSKRQGAS